MNKTRGSSMCLLIRLSVIAWMWSIPPALSLSLLIISNVVVSNVVVGFRNIVLSILVGSL